MAVDFHTMREASKQRRAGNREQSTAELVKAGVFFETKNHGTHLIVGDYDFFPGTGLWSHRKSGTTGRGVFNLIRELGASK